MTSAPRGNSFNNPDLWDSFARNALRLDHEHTIFGGVPVPDIFSEPLRAAFRELRLDPVDPYSWRSLAIAFAYVEFGKPSPGKVGAPKKWTKERKAELRSAVEQMQALNPAISQKEIARQLARHRRFSTKGSAAAAGSEGLRKAIRKVRTDLS